MVFVIQKQGFGLPVELGHAIIHHHCWRVRLGEPGKKIIKFEPSLRTF